jgi:hypothetical protein
MVKKSPQTEILTLLGHVVGIKELVQQTALESSVKEGNLPVLKSVLRKVYLETDLTKIQFKQSSKEI